MNLSSNHNCRGCNNLLQGKHLDLGLQVLSNRFTSAATIPEYTHSLVMVACSSCGLLQLSSPPPVAEIVPRFPWIMYNEPEGHLDHLAGLLCDPIKTKKECVAAGISYKDDTLLERLRERGIHTTWRISPHDLGMDGNKIEIETVQERLSRGKTIKDISSAHERPDILLVRHVLEHAHDTGAFLAALKKIIKPGALMAFEAPDCTTVLTTKDYSAIWEEHVLYFTPTTLRACLESHGFKVERIENYQYPLENSLVAFVRAATDNSAALTVTEAEKEEERTLSNGYLAAFASEKAQYHQVLNEYKSQGSKIAILGAGHLTCSFVNLLGLQDLIECVIDDDPNRQGLHMPGSRLPIVPSSVLHNGQIALCLLGLNPLNEEKVIARHHQFQVNGGRFRSIFPASKLAIRRHGEYIRCKR